MNSIIRNIKDILIGVLMAAVSIMLLFSNTGFEYMVVALILAVALIVRGIRCLIFYFTMAKHMVGGKKQLYRGILLLDIGGFTSSLYIMHPGYLMFYLVIIYTFNGVIDIARAIEAKKYQASWRLKLVSGIINMAIGMVCFNFLQQIDLAVLFFSLWILYSAVMRIVFAFRKKAIVYIQ